MVADQATVSWQVITASVRGATHVAKGLPNQDAVHWTRRADGDRLTVVSVADGHGSTTCVRSDDGSRLATALAVAIALSVERAAFDLPASDGESSVLLERLAAPLVDRWADGVRADARTRPWTGAEREILGDNDLDDAAVLRAYGSTVLLAVFSPTTLVLAQLGDGDIVLANREGDAWLPLPVDDRLIANETTSLCLPSAKHDFRCGVIDLSATPVDLVLLATDGYANSFADETWFKAVTADLLGLSVENGLDWIQEELPSWIADSAQTAGDDTTVALAFRDR